MPKAMGSKLSECLHIVLVSLCATSPAHMIGVCFTPKQTEISLISESTPCVCVGCGGSSAWCFLVVRKNSGSIGLHGVLHS